MLRAELVPNFAQLWSAATLKLRTVGRGGCATCQVAQGWEPGLRSLKVKWTYGVGH